MTTAAQVVAAVNEQVQACLTGDYATFQLFDGPSDQQAYAQRSVTVGGRWDPDMSALTGDETVVTAAEELGYARRRREITTVECIAYAGGGDLAMEPYRAVLAGLLAAISGRLRQLSDIDGVSTAAYISGEQWAHVLDDQGSGVMAMFTVTAATLP